MVRSKISLKTLHKDLAKVTRSSSFGESLKERLKRGYQKHKKAIHIGLGVAGVVGTAAAAHHYLKKNKKAEQEVKKAEHEVKKAEQEVKKAEHEVKKAEQDVKKAESATVNETEEVKRKAEEAARKALEAAEKLKEKEEKEQERLKQEVKRKEEEEYEARRQAEEAIRVEYEKRNKDWYDNYFPKLKEQRKQRLDRWNEIIKGKTPDQILADAKKRKKIAQKDLDVFLNRAKNSEEYNKKLTNSNKERYKYEQARNRYHEAIDETINIISAKI